MFKAFAFNSSRALESSIFDGNILPFFLGNVHVYRNGRMHFAHHNRQERREQQRDVRERISSGFLQFLHQLMWFHLFFFSLQPGRFGSVFPADAHPNPHNCLGSQSVDGHAASLQP